MSKTLNNTNKDRLLRRVRAEKVVYMQRADGYESAEFFGAVLPIPNGDGEVNDYYITYSYLGAIHTISYCQVIRIARKWSADLGGHCFILYWRSSSDSVREVPIIFFDQVWQELSKL